MFERFGGLVKGVVGLNALDHQTGIGQAAQMRDFEVRAGHPVDGVERQGDRGPEPPVRVWASRTVTSSSAAHALNRGCW